MSTLQIRTIRLVNELQYVAIYLNECFLLLFYISFRYRPLWLFIFSVDCSCEWLNVPLFLTDKCTAIYMHARVFVCFLLRSFFFQLLSCKRWQFLHTANNLFIYIPCSNVLIWCNMSANNCETKKQIPSKVYAFVYRTIQIM